MNSHTRWAYQKRRSPPKWLVSVIATGLFCVVFYWMGGLSTLRLDEPFTYTGDALEMLAFFDRDYIQNDVDTRLYAPYGLEHEQRWRYVANALFQSNSNLMWISHLIGGDIVRSMNVYFLLTFPLSFFIAFYVCRRIGLAVPYSFGASTLYSLMPYHFQRGTSHLFESSYYFTPLLVLTLLHLWSARPMGFQWDGTAWRMRLDDPRLLFSIFVLIFLTSFHPYHQFFFVCLAMATAVLAASYRKNWRSLAVGVGLAILASVVLVGKQFLQTHMNDPQLSLALNNAPIGAYGGAELYPLKLTQMLLPVQHHRWPLLAQVRAVYDGANPLVNENSTTTLGLAGSIGLLVCLACALLAATRRRQLSVFSKFGIISLLVLLIASMGGFSSLISTMSYWVLGQGSMLTQARGWNRMVVFVGFFGYVAAFLGLRAIIVHGFTAFGISLRTTVHYAAVALTLAFALWDQVPYRVWQAPQTSYRSDLAFFGEIEGSLPDGARIFQFPPILHHTEVKARAGSNYADQLRPFLSTQDLKFTYGADSGTVQLDWLMRAKQLAAAQLAPFLCRSAFAGILVHRNLLGDGDPIEASLRETLSGAPKVSVDGTLAYFPLSAYCSATIATPAK